MATTKITSPDLFDLGSLNTALQLPSGTTAERPTSPSTGEWRYNTTTNLIEFYDGADWRDLQSEDIPPIPSEHFNTVLYDGNGGTNNITGVGFQPDWVWIKERGPLAEQSNLYDSTRGVQKFIVSNSTAAEVAGSANRLNAFGSDGFTVGSDNEINDTGSTYVAWCWKANGGTTSSNTDGTITSTVQANEKAGFSIVQWDGTGGASTIGHGLGVVPELIFVKGTDSSGDWQVYAEPIGNGNKLVLNSTAASSSTSRFDSTSPTSSVFTFSNSGLGNKQIAYCFASKAEYSKFGSYTGNGSTNGPVINTGFEPAFLMIKRTDSADAWYMYDNKRTPSNPRNKILLANTNDAELTNTQYYSVDFLSNGFQPRSDVSTATNDNGGTYLYIAFAKNASTSSPTLNNSFNTMLYEGTRADLSIGGIGFQPSLVWIKVLDAAREHIWSDSNRSVNLELSSSDSSAEELRGVGAFNTQVYTYTDTLVGTNNGFYLDDSTPNYNGDGENFVAWVWKATSIPTINTDGSVQSLVSANQAAGFSIVRFKTPSTNNFSVGHGLGAAPDLVIYKCRSQTSNWTFYDSISGATKYLLLNGTGAQQTDSLPFNDTEPTSTVLNLGSATVWWATNAEYIAYAFKSISGYSKVGTYTGTGAAGNTVTIGFEPSWIMIKRSDSSGGWLIFDSKRNTSNPRNNRLEANNTGAEQTGSASKFVDFDATSFEPQISDSEINASGGTYVYMAFKNNPAQPAVASGYMDYLVVAGGGGSSSDSGGGAGGGAGGLRTSYGDNSGGGASAETHLALSTGTYTITVGAGGAKYDGVTTAQNGNVSSISGTGTVNTVGGGGAGDSLSSPTIYQGADGGSGGGSGNGNANYSRNTGGSGTTGEGFFGGGARDYAVNDDRNSGGGGGGAAEGGSIGRSYLGGNGGNGLMVAIDGTAAVYAGGGGGGCRGNSASNRVGSGGQGGGGRGANSGAGNAATVNTGGGAGGGRSDGANGGSGIVVLRMNTSDYSGVTSGSPVVTTYGSETILKYLASGSYTHNPSTAAGQMNYMVLAGGASGASNGGGGGAGGLRSSWYASGGGAAGETPITLSSGTYTITIGGGGASIDNSTSYQSIGNSGTATTISGNATVNTVGGGGGGSNNNPPATGGCGGGSGSGSGGPTGASGTTGEGFAGGNGMAATHPYTGGGGGGTGAVGATANASAPGDGGAGASITITGTAVNYGGGGGGTGGTGVGYTGPGGAGGTGGGGAGGAYNGSGTAGTANTGGGGGATGDAGTFTSGAGGSGLVILRLQTSEYSGTTTGSPTVTTVGTETVLTFTGSGTYVHS